jgi:hypothetical protein
MRIEAGTDDRNDEGLRTNDEIITKPKKQIELFKSTSSFGFRWSFVILISSLTPGSSKTDRLLIRRYH